MSGSSKAIQTLVQSGYSHRVQCISGQRGFEVKGKKKRIKVSYKKVY